MAQHPQVAHTKVIGKKNKDVGPASGEVGRLASSSQDRARTEQQGGERRHPIKISAARY